jgi:hypothetical protein
MGCRGHVGTRASKLGDRTVGTGIAGRNHVEEFLHDNDPLCKRKDQTRPLAPREDGKTIVNFSGGSQTRRTLLYLRLVSDSCSNK